MKLTQTLILLLCILKSALFGPVLSNFPIIFEMKGTTTYTPNSGGTTQNGYRLKVGFQYYQWLAIQIVTQTTKHDVLVIQIDEFYSHQTIGLRNGHQVTIKDYYAEENTLHQDTNTQNDMSVYKYVQNKKYNLDLVRFLGPNSGEDWNPSSNMNSLMEVCFYTAEGFFEESKWKQGLSQCYFYEINQLFSEFKGVKLKDFYLNGYNTSLYGYINGPQLKSNLYVYHVVPLFTYMQIPAIAIQIGQTESNEMQDFNVFSPIKEQNGDYYGKSVTTFMKDYEGGGFNNNGLKLSCWNCIPQLQIQTLSSTIVRINYQRKMITYDKLDRKLLSTFIFCFYFYQGGSVQGQINQKACDVVELTPHFPQMSMPIKMRETWIYFWTCAIIIFWF